METIDRRAFLTRSATLAGGVLLGATGMQRLAAHSAWAHAGRAPSGRGGYGPLSRVPDQSTGLEMLALPEGFTYHTFGRIGEPMSDGTPTPRNHDGMAAFAGPDPQTVRLIRNHEVRNAPGDLTRAVLGPEQTKNDPLGVGGTVTLDFDLATREVRDFVSLNGTIVNCAGGIALDDAGWITCEETVAGPDQGWAREHGYCFLVPLTGPEPGSPAPARPIVSMGRFSHEALTVDPRTGVVYLTEDAGDNSGFYRYLPHDPRRLVAGGRLEMLAIRGRLNYDTIRNQRPGRSLPVEWVRIPDPDPDLEGGASSVFDQGADRGGARFNRLEGSWWGGDRVFFNATSGGNAGYGQVWEYHPQGRSRGELTLFFESPGGRVLDSPDNLTVTPRGGIVLCEDDASGRDDDTHPLAPGITDVNRLIGLTAEGEPFEFAVNVLNDTEFAGACFSPAHPDWLFVNVFGDGTDGSGMTCAVTGPWERGSL